MKFAAIVIVALIGTSIGARIDFFDGVNLDSCPLVDGMIRNFECVEPLYQAGKLPKFP